jgi:hypothetical protein
MELLLTKQQLYLLIQKSATSKKTYYFRIIIISSTKFRTVASLYDVFCHRAIVVTISSIFKTTTTTINDDNDASTKQNFGAIDSIIIIHSFISIKRPCNKPLIHENDVVLVVSYLKKNNNKNKNVIENKNTLEK